MPRLFIAITAPETAELVRVLGALDVRSPVRLRPARAEALHLTLRFLGETLEARVGEVGEALRRAVGHAGILAFTMRLSGVATFEERRGRPPRVVFAKVDDPEPLQRLEAAVSNELANLAPPIPRERRPYRPHLTLARVADARPGPGRWEVAETLRTLLAPWRHAALGAVPVEAVELIESRLSPGGAAYTTRARVALPR